MIHRAWTGEKRRKYPLGSSSSSSSSSDASQDHQDMEDIIQGQHHDMLLLRSHKDGQEGKDRQEEEEEELWGPGVDISMDDIISYTEYLAPNIPPPINTYCKLHRKDFDEVQERLARHRIAYYKIAKPESGCKLKDPAEYSPDELYKEFYFVHLEEDESFEWYFHPKDSWICGLNDYQRLVVRNLASAHDNGDSQYLFWDDYRSCYHTYETDNVYVKYYGELSKKIKWIEGYLDLDRMSEEWVEMDGRAWRQALKIATSFPHMNVRLAGFAYEEYILKLRIDASLKDLDLVYFEIWKRVNNQNRGFREAVEEVYGMDKFHLHKRKMEAELKGTPALFTMEYMLEVFMQEGAIHVNVEEDEARNLFRKIVFKKLKNKNMVKYALKKIEIAERMNLVQRQ